MLKIGTSGFSFKDWIGPVYPENFDLKNALEYYQEILGFDCVEINSTYYTLVSDKSFIGMEKKTKPDFLFIVKGYHGITHDPFDYRLETKPSLDTINEDIKKFIYSISPLKEKNKLSAVLLQFPIFFYPSEESKNYLLMCKEKFKDIKLIIEFRNNLWTNKNNFDFLKTNNLSYCAVEEPKIKGLVDLIPEVTSDIAYLRLHGRNKNWFSVSTSERYNYLYTDQELNTFIPIIREMEPKSKITFIMFNNCHAGSAMKNALTLKKLILK